MQAGGCRCGAVRYEVAGEARHRVLCHCADCRASAGAPLVAWTAFDAESVRVIKGEPKNWQGTGASVRSFCGHCGTAVLFRNAETLPGIVDIPTATLDDPEAFAPQAQIQVADRIGWMAGIADLPEFERYPGS